MKIFYNIILYYKMKKIRYFDFGLYKCEELKDMENFLDTITNNFECYGFEAATTTYNKYCKKLEKNNTKIYNLAISDKHNSTINLYYCPNNEGHSIHSSKFNVLKDTKWAVKSIKFSEWLKDNNINLKDSFNIIRVNIEGAEWELFNDIIDSNIRNDINIFCGSSGKDVKKIKKFIDNGIDKKFYELLKKNNIHIYKWCIHNNKLLNAYKNVDLYKIIKKELSIN
jgi:FkbM family methyltransferase